MTTPLVVEVVRGREIESRHELDVVAIDVDGAVAMAFGDPGRNVFPRSAIKPIQVVPVVAVETAPRRRALAASSHNGEPVHVGLVHEWLAELGLGVDALACGAHLPTHVGSAQRLLARGEVPTAAHNNCSGKHTGFLAVCLAEGIDAAGYLEPTHPLQRDHVTPEIETRCGISLAGLTPGIDGCGIPVWPIPLDRLAAGWAGLDDGGAGTSVLDAMVAHPDLVAGSGRLCTRLIGAGMGRVVAKTGAEGVYCALDRESRVGLALKCRDGATRAAEVAVRWALAELGVVASPAPVVLRNWSGAEVGEIRVAR